MRSFRTCGTAKVEVEFRNGIRPADAWCVPGHANLSVVPGEWQLVLYLHVVPCRKRSGVCTVEVVSMRIARKEFMCFTLFIIVACCTACHDHESATAPERAANALTLDEVYQRGILSLIGQEILLYEDIDWKAFMKIGIPEYNEPASLSCLPMRSVSDEEANTLPIRHAWLDFEAADRYIDDPKFRNQGEGSIKIVSNDLLIEMNAMQEVQRVSYQGTLVERGHPYYVTGSFQYNSTSWFELPPQGDDACLQHVNQIEYWQDIFEFHITSVSETPPQ